METYEVQELVIKNMICTRCMKVIRQDLDSLGVEIIELRLGKIKVRFPKGKFTLAQIKAVLEQDEFEFIKDKNEIAAEQIKLALIKLVNDLPISRKEKLSDFLATKFHRDYWTTSKIFSKVEGITIEKYFILLRIEKAKELIEYDEMNFSEIAYDLGYNNVNHLSGQFKHVTGMSMSTYKKLKDKPRLPLDKIL